jgi:hypothetical protein
MEVPYAVEQLIKGFYPGSAREYSTNEQWIAAHLAFRTDEKEVIRRFLDELLSGRYSDEEIQEVWRMQYPSYDFTPGGHRYFFALIREALG